MDPLNTDKLTRQTILQRGYAVYARGHAWPDHVRRAVGAMRAGRTARLGGHGQACPEGHVERLWDHSCRHRLCPPCAWVQVERWLTEQKARLVACAPDQGILTLPQALNDLWLANIAGMSQRLVTSVHHTWVELLGARTDLGAKPGIIATRHPWSQTRRLHPPLHCLVTGGGLNDAGHWVAVRHGFLRPMRVVRALFRGALLAAIRQGVQHGQLRPPEGKNRPPVVFWSAARAKAKGEQAQRLTMRLPPEPFMGRWLLPVPPRRAVRVRCWGLYAHPQGEALARCRQQMDQGPGEAPPPLDGPREGEAGEHGPPESGPVCGQRLVCTPLFPWAGVPPPAAPRWAQVA